ncbi:hypothetical protein PVK06_017539 [Gossypium arboreum]|uniref:RNase H type-1 domain-containing protein n=1 Tax=Gossypium arboreum TaxID=29729 RepID=A0ABR0Q3D7_GOSAR|nr:hypothetical protein PVK06_017539 [Gossypium arboreum]
MGESLLSEGNERACFHDLRLFNLALLGRQVWRLLTSKDTLWHQVLSSKSFPNGDLFHAKVVDKSSYTWTSIAAAAKALENGFRWQIGDRNNINIRKDNWGFKDLNFGTTAKTMFFWGKEEEVRVIWDRAKTLCQDFRIHNLVNKPMLHVSPACKNWEKLLHSFAKINFDATVSYNKTGYGVTVHDDDGFVLEGGGGFKDEVLSAEWAELYAFEESLKIACSLNITKAIFEIDCASLVNKVKNRGKDITIMGYRINEAYKIMDSFISIDVIWANRSCNKVADFICKKSIDNSCDLWYGLSKEIYDLVLDDFIN